MTTKNNSAIFLYEEYSQWSRRLALTCELSDLQKQLNKEEGLTEKYSKQHRIAIESSNSIDSQSQRRAHSRNNVCLNYEKIRALKDAIEIYAYYPEKTKTQLKK